MSISRLVLPESLPLRSAPHDFNGARRMGDNRLCDTSHHESLETRSSVRPDDDQVCLPFICSIDDRRSWIALAYRCFDRQSRRRNAFSRSVHYLFRLSRLTLSNLFERGGGENDLGGGRRVGLNHRQNADRAWTGPRALCDFLDGVLRRCRSVNRQKNLHALSPRRVAL
jgi:hypothetical protein